MISRDRDQEKQEIKEGLKARIEPLCAKLLPGGRRQGRLWVANNPITGDAGKSPEFKVALTRDVGAWKDWRSGATGDVLRLVEYCQATDFAGAMTWSRDFLGLRSMSRHERERFNEQMSKARERAEKDAAEERLKRIGWANKLFMSGAAYGSGTAAEAHARAYFRNRQIPLEEIPNLSTDTFRFHPSIEYWKRAEFRHEGGRLVKVKEGPRFPCILSAMRTPTGQITGVHHTFLDPARPEKLTVSREDDENAKMMRFECQGAVMWICHGPENKPAWEGTAPHPLIVGEGIEDGLSQALANGDMARVVAAGSLSLLSGAPVWLPCVSAGIVCQDNDWNKPQAMAQFDAEFAELCQHGKPMTTMRSHIGKDFNDLMKGSE